MPEPADGEDKETFIARCMASKESQASFPDDKQRAAVCYSKWDRKGKKNSADCSCSSHNHKIRAQVDQGPWRMDTLNGRDMLVVPVLMAKANVVMNDALLRPEEFVPEAWNGIPVTVGHPRTGDGFVSANASPSTHENWVVGQLFNARIEGSDLKAEAWVDVERANKVAPGILNELRNPTSKMNVSTGYFSKDTEEPGEIGGKKYNVVSRDIRPNHLALLPNEAGACSWQDGCGVRSNKEQQRMTKVANETVTAALKTLGSALGITANEATQAFVAEDEASRKTLFMNISRLLTNERGEDDDHRQMRADLIAHKDSPFVPDDEESLRMMSAATLKRMRDDYCPPTGNAKYNAKEKDPKEPDADDEKDKGAKPPFINQDRGRSPMTTPKTLTVTSSELAQFIANKVDEGVAAATKNIMTNVLTPEQRESLKLLDNQAAQHRQGLVDKIVANSTMKADDLKSFSLQQLTVMANGISAQPDFSGRRLATNMIAVDEKVAKDAAPLSSFTANEKISKALGTTH